jgi:hypothetical protein
MFQTKRVGAIETQALYSVTFFPENRAVFEIMEKCGRARQATDGYIIWCIRRAHWLNKATDTHSEYAIITAFPRQQWLRERTSMLRLCLHCLSCIFIPVPNDDFTKS